MTRKKKKILRIHPYFLIDLHIEGWSGFAAAYIYPQRARNNVTEDWGMVISTGLIRFTKEMLGRVEGGPRLGMVQVFLLTLKNFLNRHFL